MRLSRDIVLCSLFATALVAGCSSTAGDSAGPPLGQARQALPNDAHLPVGQGVECFIFDDGGANMVGPTDAIFFSASGQACAPNGGAGVCRRWFGECRTTDLSHTPVTFRVGDVYPFATQVAWSPPSGAIYSRHFKPDIFSPETSQVCIPNGTSQGHCGDYFGNGETQGGRPVRCRLFDDAYTNATALTDRMADRVPSQVWGSGLGGPSVRRKWWGACEVGGGCGDGVCDANETARTCAVDCACGDGFCTNGETRATCPKDCGPVCGDGVCEGGETRSSCPADCKPTCGDRLCNVGESCSSCAQDCGKCPVNTTCLGTEAEATAQLFTVIVEVPNSSCAGSAVYFANSREDAETCAQKLGNTVVSNPDLATYKYHTDPKNGCLEIEVVGASEGSAAQCARTQGYTLSGACP